MMASIISLLERASRLVLSRGEVVGIVLTPEDREALVEFLEGLEDMTVLQEVEAKGEEEQAIPWKDALTMLHEEGMDVDRLLESH